MTSIKNILKITGFSFLILSSCGNKSHISQNNLNIENETDIHLLMPAIPQGLDHQQTIDYVLTHFWDDLNVNDTSQTHDSAFIEQNFANYSLFLANAGDSVVRQESVAKLMSRLEADSVAYKLMANTAFHYLYDPNSPLLSEEAYIPFLVVLSESTYLGEAERTRNKYLLQNALKNRPGMTAADFKYENRNGEKVSLLSTPVSGNLLLMFYDPDCEHCKEIINLMIESKDLKQMIKKGELTLLAIYTGEDKDLWMHTSPTLPQEWIVGYDSGIIDDQELYVFMATPTFYLLDSDKKIIFKDLPIENLLH